MRAAWRVVRLRLHVTETLQRSIAGSVRITQVYWRLAMRLFFTLAVLALPATLIAAPVLPSDKSKPVDVVLCLDTSNSMDGLIDSAKRKLWAIVNDIAKLEPAPTLRVALYSYGNNDYDKSKGWVRKDLDLTSDLDEVYKQLNALRTHGGDE